MTPEASAIPSFLSEVALKPRYGFHDERLVCCGSIGLRESPCR